MMNERGMKMLTVGQEVIGVWGAMFPEDSGEIVKVNSDDTVTIMFDDGSVKVMDQEDIRDDYFQPAGSPIGVYLKEGF